MTTYTAPLRDIRFVLEHIGQLPDLAELDDFTHADPDMVAGLLEEAARFCSQAVAPTNQDGDQQGCVLADGEVTTPESFRKVYQQYVEAGWGALQFPPEFGGGGFPLLVATAFKEMLTSANMAFSLAPLLTTGAVVDLLVHGSDELRQTFLPNLISGRWTGTMNLSEPQAGSDVGALTTKAIPQDDGTYRIKGTKIWITYGDQDMSENIIHLVLARLPDAPAGTKGISLFVVPKFLVEEDGSLGERNDVHVVSIEEKLGIHASPTCVMAYGENSDGAIGYLIGEPNKGMRQMFTMMNDARLGVGVEGLSIAERAYQQAAAYAQERRQGKAPGDDDLKDGQSLIVKHPDIRRTLMTMRAYIEAMRALTYRNAAAIDRSHHHCDDTVREQERKMADLLTPMSKAWCTDLGVELTSMAIQVYGGMGYVEETGVAQHFRDARIAPIYEGTNGIQAIDLVGRKLPYDGGAFVTGVIADMRRDVTALSGADLASTKDSLTEALDVLEDAVGWLFAHREAFDDLLAAATPFLRLMSTVVGGWLLAEGAAAARAELDGGADEAFLRDKIVVARFYAEQVLPQVRGLAAAVKREADDLFAIPADRLSV
jgi:alkylation response protein AidB-like acyl-CoA dehydrogenase